MVYVQKAGIQLFKLVVILVMLTLGTNSYAWDLECPIPHDARISNGTGSQCVWSSIETIGRWAGEERLYNLTDRPECQGMSDPDRAASVLNRLGVRFEQTQDKEDGRILIKKAMDDGRACLFAIPGHAMVLVHYDPEANRVHYINNSGNLSAEICTIEEFEKMWDGWVLVIYPENDPFPARIEHREILMWYYKG